MFRPLRHFSLVFLLALLGSYLLWANLRPNGHYLSDLRSEILDAPRPARLLLIRPALFSGDYRSRELLALKLDAYLRQAEAAGLLDHDTLVVLPEHIGTWLVASGEKAEVYQATDFAEAERWIALGNPLGMARTWLIFGRKDNFGDLLLRMKAKRMAADYQALFGELARRFRVRLLAGSIVLPEPRLENGRLLAGHGRLYNASLVFDRDGTVLGEPFLRPWNGPRDTTAWQHPLLLEQATAGPPPPYLRGQLWDLLPGDQNGIAQLLGY